MDALKLSKYLSNKRLPSIFKKKVKKINFKICAKFSVVDERFLFNHDDHNFDVLDDFSDDDNVVLKKIVDVKLSLHE